MKFPFTWLTVCLLVLSSCGGADDEPTPSDDGPGNTPTINERAFLTNEDYSSLEIELLVMDGMEPSSRAKNELVEFLENRLHKPDGISITTTTIDAEGKSVYSLDDVDNLISNKSEITPGSTRLTAHILFLDGNYTEGTVLGIAYGTNRMAVFEGYIKENTGGLGQPNRAVVESTVLQHEFGHTLGLVNVGTPNVSGHEDVEHKGHCDNKECLMYWAVETGDFLGNFLNASEALELDANCLADLKANGGK